MRTKGIDVIYLFIITVLLTTGCGTGYGIYHRVSKGESFENIVKLYGVNEKKLIRLNKIDDPSKIKPGDTIWIPRASRAKSAKSTKRNVSDKRKKQKTAKTRQNKEKQSKSFTKTVFIWPLKGEIISGYGNKSGEQHDGIDISAQTGDPIKAAASGRVIYSGGEIKGYGNMIIIKHKGSYSSVYAHNDENLVSKGIFVKTGEIIARVGDSGRSSGPILHFEIRNGKESQDPLPLLP